MKVAQSETIFSPSRPSRYTHHIIYLIGNFWTVFKGMPEPNETPHETALREFQEETGFDGLQKLKPEATLYGSTGKKTLEIYLQQYQEEVVFDIDQVVKIDSGYMQGRPEIIAIDWMTLEQALEGYNGAKIYNSQESILKDAYDAIMNQEEE